MSNRNYLDRKITKLDYEDIPEMQILKKKYKSLKNDTNITKTLTDYNEERQATRRKRAITIGLITSLFFIITFLILLLMWNIRRNGEKGDVGEIGDKGRDGINGKDGENGKDGVYTCNCKEEEFPDPIPDKPEPEPEVPEGWEEVDDKKLFKIYYTDEVVKARKLEGATHNPLILQNDSLSEYNFEMQDVYITYKDDDGIEKTIHVDKNDYKSVHNSLFRYRTLDTIYIDHDKLYINLDNYTSQHVIDISKVKSIKMNNEELINTNVLEIANKINYFCDHIDENYNLPLQPRVHEVNSEFNCVNMDGYYIETLENVNYTTTKNNNTDKYGEGEYLLKMNIGSYENPNWIIIGSYDSYNLLKNQDNHIAYYDEGMKKVVNLTNETYSNLEKLENKNWQTNLFSGSGLNHNDEYRSDIGYQDKEIYHWVSGRERNGNCEFTVF